VGEGGGGGADLAAARQLHMRTLRERAAPIEEDVAPVHPRREVEVQSAVTGEVDQGHIADAPGPHRGEVDLLELEPAAEVYVEEHSEGTSDRDVGPSVVVHVSSSE